MQRTSNSNGRIYRNDTGFNYSNYSNYISKDKTRTKKEIGGLI